VRQFGRPLVEPAGERMLKTGGVADAAEVATAGHPGVEDAEKMSRPGFEG
jgi:hypothetical protein